MDYEIIKKQFPALLIGIFVGAGMFLLGQNTSLSNGPNEAEVGFAQDMSVHHQQAIEMSFLIRERTGNQAIR